MKSINDDLVIMCDEILDTLENVSADYINKKTAFKMDYYIFHIFISNHIVVNSIINNIKWQGIRN